MVPIFFVPFFELSLVFARDLDRLPRESPATILIGLACFAGAVFSVAAVRQWILNERGYREYRKARTARDTFW
jgi:hypothetical protein